MTPDTPPTTTTTTMPQRLLENLFSGASLRVIIVEDFAFVMRIIININTQNVIYHSLK